MPPTVTNTNGAEKRTQPERPNDLRSELICRVKFGNTLPDIPFDLKFLQYPFDSQRFVKYNPTSLERNFKYEVLTEHDLGVTIDLINRDLYLPDPNATLDPADERLLEDDVNTPQDSVRSKQHSRSVSWLRKSEYISTEQTRFQPQNLENVEAKVGYNVKQSLRAETLYLDRDAQVKAIEKTFSDSKQEITKHNTKPNVVPVDVLPVYPDFENWKYPCAQVIFDSDPAPIGKNVPAQIEEMSQAMIRGVMDESGEQFVAYFLPTEETLEKRRRDAGENLHYKDGEEYEYKIAREYNWNVKSKASKGYEENYFFVVKNDGVYYNELETRVRLNKRRVKAGQQTGNTKLVIKHRPLDATEHRMQRYREKQLDPIGEEEDEEEFDMEEEQQQIQETETQLETIETERDREQRSRSKSSVHSRSKSKSSSRSRSGTRSRSRSGSRSGSGTDRSHSSKANSKSRSPSGSRSRSQSRSTSRSKSGSRSPSNESARSRSGSRSPSGSENKSIRERSGSESHSGRSSRSSSHSKSRSRSPSVAKQSVGSRASSRSRSPSPSHSGSGSEHSSAQEDSASSAGSDGEQ